MVAQIQEERSDSSVLRSIRKMLRTRYAMSAGEMSVRLGMPESSVLSELEIMTEHGEIERLRPVGCSLSDNDFFRLRNGMRALQRLPELRGLIEMDGAVIMAR